MTAKKTRIKHAPEFKVEALKLADKVGVAARQLSGSVANIIRVAEGLFQDIITQRLACFLFNPTVSLLYDIVEISNISIRESIKKLVNQS